MALWAVQVLAATLISTKTHSPSYAEAYHVLQRMSKSIQQLSSDKKLLREINEAGKRICQEFSNKKKVANDRKSFFILSSGVGLPIAHLWALKIGELTWIPGQALDIEEFIHSPLLTASPITPILILIPDTQIYRRVIGLTEFFDAHNITHMDIAPQGVPEISTSSFSIRFAVDRIPPVYLGIPLLHLCQRVTSEIATNLSNPPKDWRYGLDHTKLIQKG